MPIFFGLGYHRHSLSDSTYNMFSFFFFFFNLGDLDALKKQNFTMKEGVDYRVKIFFKVNQNNYLKKLFKIKFYIYI